MSEKSVPLLPSQQSEQNKSTYVHENIFCIAVSVRIPQTPGRHPGKTQEETELRELQRS